MTSSGMPPEQHYWLKQDRDIIPVLGLELEWYLLTPGGQPASDEERRSYLSALQQEAEQAGVSLHSLDIEDGPGQVEMGLLPTSDLAALIAHSHQMRHLASRVAKSQQLTASFVAKPFPGHYGSGLHVHIHLEDTAGEWLYHKRGDQLSEALNYSLGGLLATMPDHLSVFAGDDGEEALARFAPGFHAPTTVSWGMNNRTTALRLPHSTGLASGVNALLQAHPQHHKRIEHRVASSQADEQSVIDAILAGIMKGLDERLCAPPPIYGNASDAQYDLRPLLM